MTDTTPPPDRWADLADLARAIKGDAPYFEFTADEFADGEDWSPRYAAYLAAAGNAVPDLLAEVAALQSKLQLREQQDAEHVQALDDIWTLAENETTCPSCGGRVEGSPETDYAMEHTENCAIGIAVDAQTGKYGPVVRSLRQEVAALREERERLRLALIDAETRLAVASASEGSYPSWEGLQAEARRLLQDQGLLPTTEEATDADH